MACTLGRDPSPCSLHTLVDQAVASSRKSYCRTHVVAVAVAVSVAAAVVVVVLVGSQKEVVEEEKKQ